MLNHITIMGRLTRDPEIRVTGTGTSVANFSVAVDRDFASKESGEKETDFIDCVAWRKTAEFLTKYFFKGSLIVVSGRLQVRNWSDDEGRNRRSAEVVAENIYFGSSKKDSGSPSVSDKVLDENPENSAFSETLAYAQSKMNGDFVMLDDDDAQLPF